MEMEVHLQAETISGLFHIGKNSCAFQIFGNQHFLIPLIGITGSGSASSEGA
jgi:hypothetical protein